MEKIKVQLPQGTVEGFRVEYKPTAEPWCELECEDGTRLRVKLVVSDVIRVDSVKTPDGAPLYMIKSSNILQANVPEELRKAKSGTSPGTGHYR